MGKFIFNETSIEGLYEIEPKIFKDDRGHFFESYNFNDFKKAGIDKIFVQDNQSKSKKGVLRGLHYQNKFPQGKLVRVISGTVFDVAVDLRLNSPTYKSWYGAVLSEENMKQMYIPENFAHGFMVLSDEAEFTYKCTDCYHPEDEFGIAWNDPNIGIEWPIEDICEIILSKKDQEFKPLG